MIKQRKNNKSRFIKIGSLFLITGIGLISFKIISNYSIKYNEGKHIDEFFKEEKEEIITSSDDQVLKEETSATSYSYIGVLEIPSISVKRPTKAIIPIDIISAVITARSLLPAILCNDMRNTSVVRIYYFYFFLDWIILGEYKILNCKFDIE